MWEFAELEQGKVTGKNPTREYFVTYILTYKCLEIKSFLLGLINM